MKNQHSFVRQRGVALVVALLFLLVVTVISVIAASNSAIGLKMSANLQDAYSSFQSAEAGVIAAVSLANTASDPFDGGDSLDIFDSAEAKYWRCDNANNPLRDLNDGACSVTTDVFLTLGEDGDAECPRAEENLLGLGEKGGSSGSSCEYYLIESEHGVPRKARTKVALGVVKTFFE